MSVIMVWTVWIGSHAGGGRVWIGVCCGCVGSLVGMGVLDWTFCFLTIVVVVVVVESSVGRFFGLVLLVGSVESHGGGESIDFVPVVESLESFTSTSSSSSIAVTSMLHPGNVHIRNTVPRQPVSYT